MIFRKSVGAVIFLKLSDNKVKYLLLNHGTAWEDAVEYWNFPKGTVEQGEKEEETAKREIKEETGLADIKFLSGFRVVERYLHRGRKKDDASELIFKTVIFYLAQAKDESVSISSEHIGYEWLEFKEALDRLKKFKSSQKILIRADKFLNEKLL